MNVFEQLEQGTKLTIIPPSQEFLDRVSGGVVDLSQYPVIAPDGNNEKFLPDFDQQSFPTFDSDGCNIFSGIHTVEMYENALGYPSEYSEREACVMAGLTPGSGSSEEQWETFITQKGAVPHDLWPTSPNMTQDEFFAPIPPEVASKGLDWLKSNKPVIRQIPNTTADIKEALKYGPVKIFIGTGAGWNTARPSVVPRTNNPMGHAVVVTYVDELGQFWIFDQYAPYLKILASNYQIWFAFQTLIKKNTMELVENNGTYYLEGDLGYQGINHPEYLNALLQIVSPDKIQHRAPNGVQKGVIETAPQGFIIKPN